MLCAPSMAARYRSACLSCPNRKNEPGLGEPPQSHQHCPFGTALVALLLICSISALPVAWEGDLLSREPIL